MKCVHALSFWQVLLLRFLLFVIRLWGRTLRFELDESVLKSRQSIPGPYLLVFWHNALFSILEARRRYLKNVKIAGLVSASRDGAWLSGLFELCNIRPVRGSSSFRGGAAMKALLKAFDEGYSLAVTPDGPRGPCCQVKPGIIWLGKVTQMPLIVLSFDFKSAWRLKTWDQFYVPKPFSKIIIKASIFTTMNAMASDESSISLDKVLEAMLNGSH
jgi:lysophospholipid acyltransferase (LPLAT)-like uncharacterized protein